MLTTQKAVTGLRWTHFPNVPEKNRVINIFSAPGPNIHSSPYILWEATYTWYRAHLELTSIKAETDFSLVFISKNSAKGDFPGGPVAKILCSQYIWSRFDPW